MSSNLTSVNRIVKSEDKFGMRPRIPPMGPFPLEDSYGIAPDVAILDKSQDPGRHEDFVYYDTVRRVRTGFTNSVQAGVEGMGDVVGAHKKDKTWISGAVTQSFWFTRFMEGLC